MGTPRSYQYDDADRLVAVTDAAQNSTVYGYDTENNLVGITDAANHQTAFAYDALGRVTQVTFPSTLSESYTYDAVNNLLSKTDRKNQTIQYGYDPLYRLTSKTYPDSTAVNYTYDPLSRLTQVTDPSGAYSFTYDNLGRLLGTGTQYSFLSTPLNNSYSYDAASNRVSLTNSESGITYGYDSLNRLTSVTLPGTAGTVYFAYDPFGRRTRKVLGSATTIYAYDGDNITEELGGGGNLLAHYTQGAGIDEPLAMAGAGTTYLYQADGLGSITSLTDGSGQLAASYVYDSFGKLTASTGTVTNPFHYSGRELDSESGLYYYRARYYGPMSGRFLSEDPIRFRGGVSFYAYVHNNPVDLTDPQGLCVDQEKLGNCIFSLFGVATVSFSPSTPEKNGSFTGEMRGVFNGAYQPLLPGPSQFTVTNITSMTVGMLSTIYGKPAAGLTFSNMPFMNWTGWNQSTAKVEETQIYELGNSLGFITGKHLPAPNAFNVELGPANNEPGKLLLNCYTAQ